MAANSKAIGLLFEVAGGGNINGETGKRINGQLRNLVGAINKSDTLKLKFTIDSNHFKKEIDLIKKQLQSINDTSGSSGGGGASGGASKHTEVWKNATAAITKYYNLQTQVQQAITRTNDIVADGDGTFTSYNQRWDNLIAQTNKAKAVFDAYNETSARANMTLEEHVNIDNRVKDAEARLAINMKTFEANGQQAWSNLTAKVHDYIGRVEESANRNEQAKQKLQELRKMANSTDWHGYDALKDKLGEVQAYINQNALATETWYQKMLKTFGTRVRSLLAGLILAKVTTSLRDIYRNVVEIDTAMTELKIVTQANDAALEKYEKTAERAAQKIGASVSDLIQSTTTYARLGFSLDEAGILGELTTAYSKVGDVSVDEATRNITGIVKAYKVNAEDLEFVIDKLIYVGRNFAISSGEIGEGMNNAASSLAANGNTLNQAMGILTAANTTVQDISRASTATRTIAARLSASKQELEELGETVEADTITKLEKSFKAYGIEIKNSNGELKSTYGILGSIAEKWGDLSQEERSAVAELSAGTRQQDIFFSIIENWNDAQRVVAEANEATGELADATAERIDSIQGRINVLKAKFESLSRSVLSSGLVKLLVDILSSVVDFVNFSVDAIDNVIGLNTALLILAGTLLAIRIHAEIITKGAIFTFITKLISRIRLFNIAFTEARANMLGFGTAAKAGFGMATLGISTFQIALTAAIALISVAIISLNSIKQSQEEAIQTSISSARAHIQEAEEAQKASESIEDLIKQYKDLAAANNGAWDSNAIEQVQGIQDKIVDLVGDQADGIDLVNGKLQDEYSLLAQIAAKQNGISLREAEQALADARAAIQNEMKRFRVGEDASYEVGIASISENQYGDIITENALSRKSSFYVPKIYAKIKFDFETAEEFVKQYEAVQTYKGKLASTFDETNEEEVYFYNEINRFLEDYKEVYDAYNSADSLIQKLTSPSVNGQKDPFKGEQVNLKPIKNIFDEVQEGFDGIAKALESLTDDGYLTADMLASLAKLEEDNALAGLKLSDIIEHDGQGYKIAQNALEQYVDALIEAKIAQYENVKAFATEEDKQNAIDNYTNLINILKLLADSYVKSTDTIKAQKKELEEQKDVLNDQLDAYKKLIDLRKELLRQYEDEVSYKKELAKKENRVAELQTQLAISELDTSAAGRAKTRQLSKELEEAQDELDDFTLSHAIDIITNELDNQYDEYKKFIAKEIAGIEEKLDGLTSDTSSSDESGAISEAVAVAISAISELTEAITRIPVVTVTGAAGAAIEGAEAGTDAGLKTRWTSYEDAANAGYSNILGGSTSEVMRATKKYGTYQAYLDAMYEKYMGRAPVYHTGGIVGDAVQMKSTETFAKLLKGEFVATPQMMNRFMNSTLPSFVSGGGNTEINAPLISIKCDNVTQESLPRLEAIVNEAVKTIKRQFDSGLGRNTYHKSVNQII